MVAVQGKKFRNHVIILVTWYMNGVDPPDGLSRSHVMVFPGASLDSLIIRFVLVILLLQRLLLPRHVYNVVVEELYNDGSFKALVSYSRQFDGRGKVEVSDGSGHWKLCSSPRYTLA